MSTIAVVGVGPGLGTAIARSFGARGYQVALLARNGDRIGSLARDLEGEGITAHAFTADVLDHDSLARALGDAAERFGGVDVLEYSPVGTPDETGLTSPSQSTVADIQQQIEFQLYGAMAATSAVLPAMRERGAGTLLFTTGAGSIDPVPMVGNVNSAAAALRNWVINLHKEMAGTGVYAVHVGIDVSIDRAMIPGFPTAPAATIAEAYWDLHQQRSVAEFVFTAADGGSASRAEQS